METETEIGASESFTQGVIHGIARMEYEDEVLNRGQFTLQKFEDLDVDELTIVADLKIFAAPVEQLMNTLGSARFTEKLREGEVTSWRTQDLKKTKSAGTADTDYRAHCRKLVEDMKTLDLRRVLDGKQPFYSADQVADMWEEEQKNRKHLKRMDRPHLKLRVPKDIPATPGVGVWTEPGKRTGK